MYVCMPAGSKDSKSRINWFTIQHVELLFDIKIALSLLDLDTQRYIAQL